jgi:hypothetical protein
MKFQRSNGRWNFIIFISLLNDKGNTLLNTFCTLFEDTDLITLIFFHINMSKSQKSYHIFTNTLIIK